MAGRPRPVNRLRRHVAPLHLFLAGVILIVAFLFQANLLVRAIQVALVAVTATLAGKRIRPLYFMLMVVSITFFNLLTPVGRVIFTVLGLPVTAGALHQGLLKSLSILGLVFISLSAVSRDLRLPGSFGGLLARVFCYFELILEGRPTISVKRLAASVDDLLLAIYPASSGDGDESAAQGGGTDPTDSAQATTDWIGLTGMVVIVAASVILAVVY